MKEWNQETKIYIDGSDTLLNQIHLFAVFDL
jgi:hypothetical protein